MANYSSVSFTNLKDKMVNFEKAVAYPYIGCMSTPNNVISNEPQMAMANTVGQVPPNMQYSPHMTQSLQMAESPPQIALNCITHHTSNRPPSYICGSYDVNQSSRPKFKSYRYKKRSPEKKEIDYVAKLSELKLDEEKSPVAKLNEIMALKKMTVEYTLVSMSGLVHNPVFTYRVKGCDIIVYGSGKSKKEAKQNAAVEFLEKVDSINNQLSDSSSNRTITSTTHNRLSNITIEDAPKNILETKSDINPIGVLQELCMARRWQLPEYDFPSDDSGEPHNRWYRVTCSILKYKTQGEGKTKQGAKRQAARLMYDQVRLMYDQVKNLSQEEIAALCYNEPPQSTNGSPQSSEADDHKKKPAQFISTDALKQVETFFNQLKKSEKSHLSSLNNLESLNDLNTGAVELLDKIGEEEGFHASYVMLSKKTDKVGIMVQVSINPVMVYVGSGRSIKEAQEAAAFAALVYFKLMLEK
ncbi:LOW QUALITY PROTEIN: interferon-inducible double-stranded RNA-dependent protein kinase activator A homolog B-like [Daktulosphaira vitifoliae]|uniref:LOW QUALITY PROTEIN: interferon-inducible double-stranded RNA-dependent protein kinase activator A homolog B-like n=1 Tax=Daktulosphaira vitifoliae TaxID=58002 RepID=UPI0021A9F1A2|nr:LOW QUALITY PROTEIN: interferon-inducible double-stranded RNA-dependent protein kinase activator A homolog B-like [Daktulosphaira vitifoliae]